MKPQNLNSGQHFFLATLGAVVCQFAIFAPVYASCGAAFCSVNSDWGTQGTAYDPGARVGLRYEYIKQDQLRAGSNRTSAQGLPDTHDEISTYNRNMLASFDYVSDTGLGLAVQLPVLNRAHSHIHNDPANGPETETWHYTEMGDISFIGHYQFPRKAFQTASGGIKFGIKLPTGRIDQANADNQRAERSLQPGSGSTDLIAGADYRGQFPGSAANWFIQGLWQHAVTTRDNYRPGDHVAFDLGVSYYVNQHLSLLLQLNTLIKSRDGGANAEPESSGGRSVNISPGLSYAVSKNVQMYGFIQTPIYQYVNGVQLTSDWSVVTGIGYHL
ncbi:MAG: transporter [Sulfuriferula sp.]